MRYLDLSHNELRESAGKLLGHVLVTILRYIILFYLYNIKFLTFSARNEDLEELDLSWNHLRGKGAEGVALGLVVSNF